MADLADLVAAAYARVNIFSPLVDVSPFTDLDQDENMFFFSHEGACEGDQGVPSPSVPG